MADVEVANMSTPFSPLATQRRPNSALNPASNVGDTKTVEFSKIPKIRAGLTLRTPQRPKGEIFCIRRSKIIGKGRTALLNALNSTFLRSSLTEILCFKLSENSENRHRAYMADPQAAKGLEILYTLKRRRK
jgi:hypothetical protein